MDSYQTEHRTINGLEYRIEWFFDDCRGAPWDEDDGHGPVSNWQRRDKRPGEIIIADDGQCRRFYDFAAAVRIARRDGWNVAPYDWKTPGQRAHAAAVADLKRMRDWCEGQWHWCGVVVTALNDEEEEAASASLWGIESDAGSYFEDVIGDLVAQCGNEISGRVYPVTHCGV